MSNAMPFPCPPARMRLPLPGRAEAGVSRALLEQVTPALHWAAVQVQARPWVLAVREHPAPFWAMESLLKEYPISSAEGLALMRLAEALLRVPDAETAIALTADQLGQADFDGHRGGGHAVLSTLSATAIAWTKKLLPGEQDQPGLLQRLGAQTVVAAAVRAVQLLGRQFVLGRDIAEAQREAQRPAQGTAAIALQLRHAGRRRTHRRRCATLPGGLPRMRSSRSPHATRRARPRRATASRSS